MVVKQRIALLFYQATGPPQADALRALCSSLGRVVRSFTVTVLRGCLEFLDLLLMGWW